MARYPEAHPVQQRLVQLSTSRQRCPQAISSAIGYLPRDLDELSSAHGREELAELDASSRGTSQHMQDERAHLTRARERELCHAPDKRTVGLGAAVPREGRSA